MSQLSDNTFASLLDRLQKHGLTEHAWNLRIEGIKSWNLAVLHKPMCLDSVWNNVSNDSINSPAIAIDPCVSTIQTTQAVTAMPGLSLSASSSKGSAETEPLAKRRRGNLQKAIAATLSQSASDKAMASMQNDKFAPTTKAPRDSL